MSYSISSTGGEMRWMPMYEFKVRLKILQPPNNVGMAKWTGTTRQDRNGIFRPLFEIKLDDDCGEPFLLTQEDFEFLEPPMIL